MRLTAGACGLVCAPLWLLAGAVGPTKEQPFLKAYAELRYVAASGSDHAGDGSAQRPWRTLSHALNALTNCTFERRCAILVGGGIYQGATVQMKPFIDLYGGFQPGVWRRDPARFASILDGEQTRRVVVGADQARLDGFIIRNGRVRGYGAGLLCAATSPWVSNNVFIGNRTLTPERWQPKHWHEDAHDGGGLAATHGAAPRVEGNLFVRNETEVGRGAGLACHDRAAASIVGNVFLENRAGVADPARSSDGGAISIYGRSRCEVRGNLIVANEALGRNDGGGIFVALWSSPVIAGNRIVGNYGSDDGGGLFLGGQKHHYETPLDPVPGPEEFEIVLEGNLVAGNRSSAPNSGAMRIAMQARARLLNNVVVHNPGGVYVQSSAAVLWNNTIDAFLFVNDSKASRQLPGPTWLMNTIVRGDRTEKTPIDRAEGNLTGAQSEACFVRDAVQGIATELAVDAQGLTTALSSDVRFGNLAMRAVRVAGRWSVVKESAPGKLIVWGNLAQGAPAEFFVAESFHLAPDSTCIDRGVRTGAPEKDFDLEARPFGAGIDIGADEHHPGGKR